MPNLNNFWLSGLVLPFYLAAAFQTSIPSFVNLSLSKEGDRPNQTVWEHKKEVNSSPEAVQFASRVKTQDDKSTAI